MSKLKQPLRLWHGLLAIAAALAVGAAGTAIAGGGGEGKGKDLTTAGVGGSRFLHSGKYHYGFKAKTVDQGPTGNSQESVRLKCPRGTRVLSGGGGGLSGDPTEQNVNFTAPFDGSDRRGVPDNGWITYVNNVDLGGSRVIGVVAICRDKR